MNTWPDLLRKICLACCLIGLLTAISVVTYAQAQDPDEADGEVASNLPEGHSPDGALWRSVAIPGWGQYYNRQPLKIPVVYAGLGGIAWFSYLANDQYYRFRNIHRYAQQPEEYPQYAELAEPFQEEIQAGRTEFLRRERERFRRYRDLSVVGFVAFYAFSVLDAYVSAHLLHFDVDEDLSLRVHGDQRGPGATLSIQF